MRDEGFAIETEPRTGNRFPQRIGQALQSVGRVCGIGIYDAVVGPACNRVQLQMETLDMHMRSGGIQFRQARLCNSAKEQQGEMQGVGAHHPTVATAPDLECDGMKRMLYRCLRPQCEKQAHRGHCHPRFALALIDDFHNNDAIDFNSVTP